MEASFKKISQSYLWGASILIFATVGSSETPFNRLVAGVDKLAAQIDEAVKIQIGASTYIPSDVSYFDFCDAATMESLIKQARIIIAHAGFGVIANCIRLKKPMILVPREHRFAEAEGIQTELAEYLARTTRGIFCVRKVDQLKTVVDQISNIKPNYHFKTSIPQLIQNFIDRGSNRTKA